ncbi:MAG: HisA/HisF-related TIM barrel protein [Ruthenibacterium lactatiformans]
MLSYPAESACRGGQGKQVVRLTQGDYGKVAVYGTTRGRRRARLCAAQGATYLHAVDLDGAKDGALPTDRCPPLCKLPLSVEVGGGMRTEADVEATLALGADRVILGTAAVEDFGVVERLVAR